MTTERQDQHARDDAVATADTPQALDCRVIRMSEASGAFEAQLAPFVLQALHQLSISDLPPDAAGQPSRLEPALVEWDTLGDAGKEEVYHFFDLLAIEVQGRVLEIARSLKTTMDFHDEGALCPFGLQSCS